MKYNNETYDEWAKKVDMFERGHALQRIANGEPAELVLEEMGKRMTDKLLHPIFKLLKDHPVDQEALAESRKRYEEIMKSVGLKADHVLDENNFDKSE